VYRIWRGRSFPTCQ